MKKGDYLTTLLRNNQTVFSFKDMALLWNDTRKSTTAVRANYYVKTGKLYHLRRGIYAKDKNYDKFELAIKIFTPSYISFETVLLANGLIFQFYNTIFVASYLSREIECDGQTFHYKKIRSELLTNEAGIKNMGNYFIAEKERAFLDTLYLFKEYYFDNLHPLDWKKVFEILPIYNNKRMNKSVDELYRSFKNEKERS